MPSTSKKQSAFMKAVANNPKFAKKAGVSSKVGKDFAAADKKAKKFAKGGNVTPAPSAKPSKAPPVRRGFNDPDGARIPTDKEAAKLMAPRKPAVKPKAALDLLGSKKFAKGGKAGCR